MSSAARCRAACRSRSRGGRRPNPKVVACSGGGDAPDNEPRKILNSYDGSPEHMRRIVAVMFVDPNWARDDAYIARRQELATLPGAWEATQAARFKAPFRKPPADRGERDAIRYDNIRMPCLIMAGRLDPLRSPGYADKLAAAIPGAELHVFQNASHMANIECAAEFNDRLLRFLKA
jgi:2-hydroxymuconate-semialdehyde hydrolase